MATQIPSAQEVRQRLLALSWSQLRDICERTGAPFTTVWKVRSGETSNPGLETVRLIWPDLKAPKRTKQAA
jgi:transcriptional regulator with XRE-family HTH domain